MHNHIYMTRTPNNIIFFKMSYKPTWLTWLKNWEKHHPIIKGVVKIKNLNGGEDELCTWECLVGLSISNIFFYENKVSLSHLGVLILSTLYKDLFHYVSFVQIPPSKAFTGRLGTCFDFFIQCDLMLWGFSMKGSDFVWLCVLF